MSWRGFTSFLRLVGRLARRGVDLFPLTGRALLVLLVAAYALWAFAHGEMDVVVFVLGYGALALVSVAVLVVMLAAVSLWWILRRRAGGDPLAIAGPVTASQAALGATAGARAALFGETGRALSTDFELSSLAWLPLVHFSWTWEEPGHVRVAIQRRFTRLSEFVVPTERGVIERVRRRLVVEDAFGLARIALRHSSAADVHVLPSQGALRRVPLLVSLSGGDDWPHPMGASLGDRMDLRRYVAGDPARFIHWKVYARTRKLVVRVPERALSRSRRTVAYQVAGPDDDASAALARVALESGALVGDWVFGADGASFDATSLEQGLELIRYSIKERERGGAGLESFVKRVERAGPSTLVVFAPPVPGPWLEPLLRVARAAPATVRVCIGVDGLASQPVAPSLRKWRQVDRATLRHTLRRLLTLPSPMQASSSEALDAVLAALGGARCEVTVFDRRSGRLLGAAHRQRAAQMLSARPSAARLGQVA